VKNDFTRAIADLNQVAGLLVPMFSTNRDPGRKVLMPNANSRIHGVFRLAEQHVESGTGFLAHANG